ncbi:hypothetical protein NE237_019731 [Protea cynaroides]|uniref:Saccharopine dehydrogenase NADP binding domain-containing protein n=1 Tax=Protea cynaroides TaxID=273540 RepID=A0A9Q0K1M9_9MAGN|nr:hypothetical protein NE237_019731 [Protea cynaroides]
MNHFPSRLHSSIKKTAPVFLAPSLSRFYCKEEESVSQVLSITETFVSYLENCPDITSLRKLHARIFAHGLGNSIFLGSKLLNCYASFDSLTESRWVFDRIINRNLSLWNSILVGYFRTNHFDEVLKLYLNLKRQNIDLDSSTLTFSLKSCTELRTVEVGRGIHVDAFKFGLSSDRFVGSSLIGLYSKYGDIEDARAVFEEMSERDVVACTAMITGYAQISDSRAYEAFRIFCDMQEEGLNPNRVTLVSLLHAAAHLRALEEGRSVHGYAIRRGTDSNDEVMETSLVGMYIKCGAPDMAASIFHRMNERTIASWNALISGHVQMGRPLEALNLLCLLVRNNLTPDLITLANGLLSCADLECLHKGKSIHCYIIRRGIDLDLVATTALVDMYSSCNSVKQARELFDKEETKDVILFNVMIAGYLQSVSAYKAIGTFCEMVKAGIRPNMVTILSILSASADLTDIRKGSCIHGYILRHRLEQNIEITNQILHMYAKCGRIDIAWQFFNRMKDRDLVSWTSMMMSCVHHGHAGEAISILRLMQIEKLNPDSVTLLSLLQAISQLGYLKLAKEVHGYAYRGYLDRDRTIINSLVTTYAKCGQLDMAKNIFENTIEHCLILWNTMIAAYGMHGNCEQVLELFDRMRREKVVPDELTFTSILSACSHAGLVEEGRHVFHFMMTEYLITPGEEHYGCMVDLLGRAGHLEEAYDLVKCLPSSKSASALSALLAACRVHRNLKMGETIGKQLIDLEPENSGTHTLLSNIYAEAGQWDEVARIRAIVKERGLRKMPGFPDLFPPNFRRSQNYFQIAALLYQLQFRIQSASPPKALRSNMEESHHQQQHYDLVILGASGFTGKYVVREALKFLNTPSSPLKTLALAGRDPARVSDALKWAAHPASPPSIPIIKADVADPASLRELCSRTKLVLDCIGPFRLYGEPVVSACVEAGCDYLDICGEPEFMERMEAIYYEKAVEKGSLVVSACGFDSVPAELGLMFNSRQWEPPAVPNRVEAYLSLESKKRIVGNFGTFESAVLGVANMKQLQELRRSRPRKARPVIPGPPPKGQVIEHQKTIGLWALKLPSADSIVVRRTLATLTENPHGLPGVDEGEEQMEYRKSFWSKVKPAHFGVKITSKSVFGILPVITVGMFIGLFGKIAFGRWLLLKFPSIFSLGGFRKKGPTEEEVESATFKMWFVGHGYSDGNLASQGNRKPDTEIITRVMGPEIGYLTTPIILLQCALVVLKRRNNLPRGGVLTPGIVFGPTDLQEGLQQNGISFDIISKKALPV